MKQNELRGALLIASMGGCLMGSSLGFVPSLAIPNGAPNRRQCRTISHCMAGDSMNTPESFSFAEIQREMSRRKEGATSNEDQESDAFMDEQMSLRKSLKSAHVVVYNPGEEEEGVYTLFTQGRNVLLAWQDKAEASRYALMLQAENMPLGKPTELPLREIMIFCKENGVGLELVPRGRNLQPPNSNKAELDFDVAKADRTGARSRHHRRDDSLFTQHELERIKRQLDRTVQADEAADADM